MVIKIKECYVIIEFSNWKHAIKTFNNHEGTGYHKTCIENYKIMCHNIFIPVNFQLDKVAAAEVIENRKLIEPLIECILLCGRQGLSLRGHNYSEPILMEHEPVENYGNFRALLRVWFKNGIFGEFRYTID